MYLRTSILALALASAALSAPIDPVDNANAPASVPAPTAAPGQPGDISAASIPGITATVTITISLPCAGVTATIGPAKGLEARATDAIPSSSSVSVIKSSNIRTLPTCLKTKRGFAANATGVIEVPPLKPKPKPTGGR
ncbi:RasGAP C-terminus family protein [Aspergillus niger]|uniref:RasGAP C-terminus family protein n=1 Tax=Aspergillus niger TaxID=5061 RepID=A0A505IBC4_ASPNG|nr:RasGAP C-terminus family protein [Aspergillus niger]